MKLPRMWDWILFTVVAFGMVFWVAPQQINVVLYKALLVSLAAVLSYWVDHSLFKRHADRIDENQQRDIYGAARVLSRAIMFLACSIGMTMGL